MKNSIGKIKALRLHIVTLSLFAWAIATNLFRKNRATHVFYYSEKQKHCCDGMIMLGDMHKPDVKVKGKEYTEMRQFLRGISNWEDVVIVGIGGYNDISVG